MVVVWIVVHLLTEQANVTDGIKVACACASNRCSTKGGHQPCLLIGVHGFLQRCRSQLVAIFGLCSQHSDIGLWDAGDGGSLDDG